MTLQLEGQDYKAKGKRLTFILHLGGQFNVNSKSYVSNMVNIRGNVYAVTIHEYNFSMTPLSVTSTIITAHGDHANSKKLW